MTGVDVALLVLLALAAAVFWSATFWGWRTDRREWSAAPAPGGGSCGCRPSWSAATSS